MSAGTKGNWKVVTVTSVVPFESAEKVEKNVKAHAEGLGAVMYADSSIRDLTEMEWLSLRKAGYDGL